MTATNTDQRVSRRGLHRRLIPLMLMIAFLAAPGLLSAAEPISPLLDRYAFTLGSYFTAVDTDVQANDVERDVGTRVDFETDMGFGSSDELFRAEAQIIFKRRHQVNLAYYSLDRSASKIIEREIEWRDRTFPVNAEVSSFWNTDVTELSYTYWWIAREKSVFGVNAGFQLVGFDIGAALATERFELLDPDVSVSAPVPLLGIEYRRQLTDKLMFRGIGRAVKWGSIEEITDVVIYDFALGFEHRTFKNGGIGIAYKLLRFDIEFEGRFVTGDFVYGLDGIEVFLRFWR